MISNGRVILRDVLGFTFLVNRQVMASESNSKGELAGAGPNGSEIPLRTKESEPRGSGKMSPKSPKQSISKSQEKGNLLAPQNEPSSSTPKTAESRKDSPSHLPDFVLKRNQLFDELKRKHDAEILEKEHPVINVVLNLGSDRNGTPVPAMPVAAKAWESTPASFLKHVNKDISSDVVVAKVDGKELWDLNRPLERDCSVSYIPFTSPEGRNVFWHSSAHVLGEAAECHYNCLLSHGPPVEQGFFYDMAIAGG